MQKITPHLWYDKEAKEAAEFYVATFGGDSRVTNMSTLHDTPSGDADIVSFELLGQPLMAISAGPHFKFNPSISLMINFDPSQIADAATRIDEVWGKLALGGKVLMPIQEYSWSKRYGWIQDKYGLSWQLILTKPEGDERPLVIPSLLFTDARYGQAEAAREFYLSVFKTSKAGALMHYGPGQPPNREGTVMFADFKLFDLWFAAMDGAGEHNFAFNEAVSFIFKCEDQAEIDYYWSKLSAVPAAEQCGWLKDKFGISWQIVPRAMDEMLKGDQAKVVRVTQAFLKMKKFDLAELERVARG